MLEHVLNLTHIEEVSLVDSQVPWYAEGSQSGSSWLSDEAFLRYATCLMWLAVCTTGLGLELVLGEPLIRNLGEKPEMLMGPWKVAQLFFAVCITVALFSRSPFGFPFMIVGFWKFVRRVGLELCKGAARDMRTSMHLSDAM